MRRLIGIGEHSSAVPPNQRGNGGLAFALVMGIVLILLAVLIMVLGKDLSSKSPPPSPVEDAAMRIYSPVNSHIDTDKELKGDEKVYLNFDEEWAETQERMRSETRRRGIPMDYYDVMVGDKKVAELKAGQNMTINVRGTADHYTIEIFNSMGSGKYDSFDNRYIYEYAKGNSK